VEIVVYEPLAGGEHKTAHWPVTQQAEPAGARPGVVVRHTRRVATGRSVTSVDDERVRVTTWTFDDGQDTGPHRHEYDYVVVPVSGGTFEVVESDGGSRQMVQKPAAPYIGREGTEHNVINRSGREAVFVEVELKRA
jgi:quercetin dioxygenase-like cupin family protein